MASEKKLKKEKEILYEVEVHVKDIRQQLNEQLKCLDARLENHLAMLWELQDFYKRRAEVENEYAKALDRLVKQIMLRHKSEKQKVPNPIRTDRRELWPGFSTYTCWQTLLASTKRESKDHAILSDLYNTQLCNRFTEIADDIQRIYKKCREIGSDCHEELIKVLHELHSSMKTYHIYHGESKQAESKLKHIETQKSKVEQHASKGTLSRKFKSFEKQTEKRQTKYTENKLKALKARNDYILCIDAANAAINKYYVDDLPDMIDAMDFGYHIQLSVAMKQHVSAEENCMKSKQACLELMNKCVSDLDQRTDKQRFLEIYNQTFSLPKKFDFQAHKGDEVCQLSAQKTVQDELLDRQKQISNRLNSLKLENDEVWKTLETAEKSLVVMMDSKDYDTTPLFQEENKAPKSPLEYQKWRSDRLETEAFYLQKFREYLLGNNLMARLQAKNSSLTKALGEGNVSGPHGPRPPSLPPKPKKRRIGRTNLVGGGQPKLFGGSIEEYIEVTGQEIPLIVRSCVRVINLHGMHHQGVFRVSGSQHEINEFRNCFEKGEDPLLDVIDGKDINSVAGVLKLYFRELKEPLFPVQMFEELIGCSRMETVAEFLERLKELLSSLPRPIIIVMRYLFAFLNHLTEYSDENMMDPYNLAICFGPTLLPIPPDRDQVQYQSNVNELIKNIIIHQEEVFPHDGGYVYEKCIIDESEQDTTDAVSDEEESTDAASEEETEVIEAVAQYDFTGRTERELTFKKGDILVVFNQVSTDWWEGAFNGKEGLIPDKYIQLRQREEDRKSGSSEEEKRRSTESLPAHVNTSLSVEDLDKSASQPNIAMTSSVHADFGASLSSPSHGSYPNTTTSKTVEYGKLMKRNQGNSNPSISSKEGNGTLPSDLDLNQSTEDMSISRDIESALAEVMSGLKSLELQQSTADIQTKPLKAPLPSAKQHTPDLVLDLPVSAEPPSPKQKKMEIDVNSPDMSTAEVFAKNQCTIKKGMSMPRNMPGLPVEQDSPTNNSPPLEPAPVRRTYSSTSATIQRRKAELERELNRSPSPIWDQRSSDPRPNVPSKSGEPTTTVASTFLMSSSLAKVLPDRPEKPPAKPKPPVKIKPPVMKKPTRSPEIGKRSSNSSDESADISHA